VLCELLIRMHSHTEPLRNPGWRERLLRRTGGAAAAGAAAGTCLAIVRNEPALPMAGRTAGSFGIVAVTFCSLQELCRLLRQADGPENSLLAGAGAGALLRGVHHGRAFALPGAFAAASVAYTVHRLLDARRAGATFGVELLEDPRLLAWLPIKRISDEELAAREVDGKVLRMGRRQTD